MQPTTATVVTGCGLIDTLDEAIKTDPRFAETASEKTWNQYRSELRSYCDWLSAAGRSHREWSDPVVFARFLNSRRLSKASLTKYCTAINKLAAATAITGTPVAAPTRTSAVRTALATAASTVSPQTATIDPARSYQITEAAEALGVSPRTVRRRLDDGLFPLSRLEPGRTGQTWTIPGSDLLAEFTAPPAAPNRRTEGGGLARLEQALGLIDASTDIGKRDHAALQLKLHTQLSDAVLTRLQLANVDLGARTIAADSNIINIDSGAAQASLAAWTQRLTDVGAQPITTLWPPINRGGRIQLHGKPVRIGHITHRRTAAITEPTRHGKALASGRAEGQTADN